MSNLLNIQLAQGTDFLRLVTIKSGDAAMDLTGCTFVGQARENFNSSVPAFSFSFALKDQGVADTKGQFEWSLANTALADLVLNNPKQYFYDVIMTNAEDKKTAILSGQCIVKPLVSKVAP